MLQRANAHDGQFKETRESKVFGGIEADFVAHVLHRGDVHPADGVATRLEDTCHQLVREDVLAPVAVGGARSSPVRDGNRGWFACLNQGGELAHRVLASEDGVNRTSTLK